MNRIERKGILVRLVNDWLLLIDKRADMPKNRKPYKRKHLDEIDRAIAVLNARIRLNTLILNNA